MNLGNFASQKYFDQRIQGDTNFVLPGFHFVQTNSLTPISTLLGSCVSACIYDTKANIGGLNHFLLPEQDKLSNACQSSRYGVHAMEVLINDLLKSGARKINLAAKVFGGAKVIQSASSETVGTQNCEFVKSYLNSEKIPISAEDLGGEQARRIYFFSDSGRVSVLRIPLVGNEELRLKDIEMRKKALEKHKNGGVELF